ncbi:DUF1295 domain-containing protein [Barrientosiimonas endolithica]|uniref:Steroid 5-alpha reductase C-terminal domain-containing protein n=1 Tax=Barrientosiimonas endolithica TaxID=1535208 RepID=A0ABN6YY59_9MICO|nr:DUF1295 domain-containing protein [Barrientosiimonas endolithica]BDZ59888.1 hypothetical protein GCM10025872_35450 [Barrientosiimonas endolithica]
MGDFAALSLLSLALVLALQLLTYVVSRRAGRLSVVDVTWGVGLALVALLSAAVGSGDAARRTLLAVIVVVWGSRLAWHIHRRSRGKGEDPRYARLAEGRSRASVFVRVFLTQGLAQWFVSLPVQVSASTGPPRGLGWALVVLGVVVSASGLVVEAVADRQLAAFKADPDSRGRIMDRGLWNWSRHPNYFGDACVWVGVYLVACAVWPGVLTVLSPAAMVWFLVVATGARLLERHMADRPGFADYQRRTSFFVPLPPRKG